jgi:probable F420-dependent oxidoreductase
MRFLYSYPGRTVPLCRELFSADAVSALAVAAESAGFDGIGLDDHPAPPQSWRMDPSGHDGVDPLVALAGAAAATSTIRLVTSAIVLPFRNPLLLASAAATLDVLSQGRLTLGTAAGYLEAEFAALGVDFADRNALFDEAVEVLELAWTGRPFTYHGRDFDAVDVCVRPQPVQQPHPPIWIGGNSRRSLRRAADTGAGWMTFPNARGQKISRRSAPLESVDDLVPLLSTLRQFLDEVERREPIGVTWVTLTGTAKTVLEALEGIDRFGDEVISASRRRRRHEASVATWAPRAATSPAGVTSPGAKSGSTTTT